MKNKTPKNLIAVAVMAIVLLGAQTTFAYVPGVWDPQPRVQTNSTGFVKVAMPYDEPVTYQTNQTPPSYYNQNYNNQNYNQTANTTNTNTTRTTTTTNRTVSSAPRSSQTTVSGDTSTNSLYPVATDNSNGNDLTALSLEGSGGFLPSSIWQWFLVILLILVAVIIFRSLKKPQAHHAAVH